MTEQKEQQIRVWAESCLFKHDKAKIMELLAEIDALRAECAVARERFGPAGYKIITEVAQLREQLAVAREALEATAGFRAKEALEKIARIDGGKG